MNTFSLRRPAATSGVVLVLFTLLLVIMTLGGCTTATTMPASAPLGQSSFASYRQETVSWLHQRRAIQSGDAEEEIQRNAPQEWRPPGQPVAGILLVHGLGDSPWSFNDIAESLVARGFLVRTVLLPGHGTQPSDLLGVSMADWRRVVAEQMRVLTQEVPAVYLGGFSTGANLAVDYAIDHAEVRGLLLFSPAFKSSIPMGWLSPALAKVRPWLVNPQTIPVQQTAVRYINVPTNGFAQYYGSSVVAQRKIARTSFGKPVLLVLAEHDSVVDVDYVHRVFESRFTHPDSRMIWYGEKPPGASPRIHARTDRIPEEKISQFSHMGILFAPSNPLYGRGQRNCANGQPEAQQLQCEQGEPVWFSEWGYTERSKVHARLTFNPYFEWQSEVMAGVLRSAELHAQSTLPASASTQGR